MHVTGKLSGSLPAKGYRVVNLGSSFLHKADLGGSAAERAFEKVAAADGLRIVRPDAMGFAVIDMTPTFVDPSPGGLTWQRRFDGAPSWTLARSTSGANNDPDLPERIGIDTELLSGGIGPLIQFNLVKIFQDAYDVLSGKMEFSVDFVKEYIREVITRFINDVLEYYSAIISSATIWFQALISGGLGVRLSVTIEGGENLVMVMRWAIETVATFIDNLGKANLSDGYPSFPRGVLDDITVTGDLYFRVPVPQVLKSAMSSVDLKKQEATQLKTGTAGKPGGMELAITIGVNVPLLGRVFMNEDWGPIRAVFGACARGLPAPMVSRFFGTSTHEGGSDAADSRLVDLWMLRAELFEVT